MTCHVDIAIVGGGLVGAGLALALADSSLRVALIEARAPNPNDKRLFGLNVASSYFLKNLGIWDDLSAHASPMRSVHVSREKALGTLLLDHATAGLPVLGYVIPAVYIEEAMAERLRTTSHLLRFQPATLTDLVETDAGVNLTLATDDGDAFITATKVFAADGAESFVRKQLGLPTRQHDYDEYAAVMQTHISLPHDNIAFERFTDDGVMAMLPLPGHRCATIWTGKKAFIEDLMSWSSDALSLALSAHFKKRLGDISLASQPATYPLQLTYAEKVYTSHIFLLGNAAHTLHPIAAQGFNLALYEVAQIVDWMHAQRGEGVSLKEASFESLYQRIHARVRTSVSLSHGLALTAGCNAPLLSTFFGLGLLGLNVLTPLKRQFIRRMAGCDHDVPRLLLDVG